MKNIIKNLIFVIALVGVFGIGANFAFAAVPTIVGTPTATVNGTSVTFSAVVNPNSLSTNLLFETDPGGQIIASAQNITTTTTITYTKTGLAVGSYLFKVTGANSSGPISMNWISFTISSGNGGTGVPTIVGTPTATVNGTSVTFSAVVNPNGAATNLLFEIDPGGQIIASAQNITATTTITYTKTGLAVGSYLFKVTGANSIGPISMSWIPFTISSGNGGTCSTNGPTISSISPSDVTVGASQTDVTITGTNFTSASVALFGGADRTYAFVNSTTLTMRLPATELVSAGTASVTVRGVVNGTTCTSNSRTFTISASGGGGGGGGGGSSHLPDAVTDVASNLSSTSVILNGTVDPNGYTSTAWFEFGTSTSSSLSNHTDTPHLAQGSGNSDLDFAQSISGLAPNTTYYFRAVANNQYGTDEGSIRSFVTEESTTGLVTTVQATSIGTTSVRANGIFSNLAGSSAQGYFEYGTSVSLGSTTALTSLGTTSSVPFSSLISGLTAGRIYYFRAVVNQGGVPYYGNILVFQTTSSGVTNTNPPITTTQSSILSITTDTDGYLTGDEINYFVTFRNPSNSNFENVKITVQLPKEVDFKESNFGKEESKNTVVSYAGTLLPSQVGSMTIKGKINSKASGQSLVVTTAVMSLFEVSSNYSKDEIAYVTNHISQGGNLTAASLFGDGSFLPSTLIGWLALILVILVLAVLGRRLYSSYMLKTASSGNGNHIDNLPR